MSLSVTELLRGAIPDWNDDVIASGVDQPEERVVFDLLGHAYTVVITGNHGHLLLHSRDDMNSWDVHELAGSVSRYRIETTAADRPPVLFRWKHLDHPENPDCQNGRISIIAPNRNADGTLTNLDPIEIQASFATDGPSHSGVADMTVTRNNKTHVVYPGTSVVVGHDGTPHWVATYGGPVIVGVGLISPNSILQPLQYSLFAHSA